MKRITLAALFALSFTPVHAQQVNFQLDTAAAVALTRYLGCASLLDPSEQARQRNIILPMFEQFRRDWQKEFDTGNLTEKGVKRLYNGEVVKFMTQSAQVCETRVAAYLK